MQDLTGTVGEQAANARHDVALVQAALTLIGRPAGLDPARPKYLDNIDGECGPRTTRAIRQFQYDQVFVGPNGISSRAVPGAKDGAIVPRDVTWKKLDSSLADGFRNVRALAGSKIVYLAGTQADLSATLSAIEQLTFQREFRANVRTLINRVFERRGIVVGVCTDGDRRAFQTQYDLLTSGRGVTNAGPGESNHNFGQGVDLGFAGLRWLRPNGTVVEDETSWLHRLDPAQHAGGESRFFWDMLRLEGTSIGMCRGPISDRPHLQAWSDDGIDMAERLADLLTRAGTMRWQGRRQRYQCDLGLGGAFVSVGSAAQIWNREATITETVLRHARAQAAASSNRAGTPFSQPAVSAEDIRNMRESLRADFEAADRRWTDWRAR